EFDGSISLRVSRYVGAGHDQSVPTSIHRGAIDCALFCYVSPGRMETFSDLGSNFFAFNSPSHSSTRASAISRVTFSTNSSLTWRTGAGPHEARHSAVINVLLPSAVAPP